jgi:hypothetical protein
MNGGVFQTMLKLFQPVQKLAKKQPANPQFSFPFISKGRFR